jgi:hypothetical protein
MKKKWNRTGSVLLIVVFAIALLTTLVTGMLQMNTEELMLMQNQVNAAETLAIANAGLNDALVELRNDSSWNTGFTDKTFSDGTYTVTVSGALPFLTVLAPSKKTNIANSKRHKTSIDWIMQMISQVRRWLPARKLVLVVDGGLIALKLGHRCLSYANQVTLVARFRLDARLYDWPEKQPKGKRGPKPQKGKRQLSLTKRLQDSNTFWRTIRIRWYGGIVRTLEITSGQSLWYTPGEKPLPIRWVLVRDPLGKMEATAFLCTDLDASPEQILDWYVMRWNVEVTFEDARAHLGLETQRQWSDLAIARTTPALLGLYSLVVLLAQHLLKGEPIPVQTTAWYTKREAAFSDVIAFVRQYLWAHTEFEHSHVQGRHAPIPDSVLHGLVDLLCYAA